MLRNYFKIALRNLSRNKLYTFLNIAGLATGITCCLLIMFYVRNELSFDRFHDKADHIYRVWVQEKYEGEIYQNVITPIPLGPILKATYPEVEHTVRVATFNNLVQYKDLSLPQAIHVVDSTFFNVFDFKLIQGDARTALREPYSVILTPRVAGQFFGKVKAVGQRLAIRLGETYQQFTVTAIAEEPPLSSSIRFGMLLPAAQLKYLYNERAFTSWFTIYVETYALLRANTNVGALESKFPQMVKSVLGKNYKEGAYLVNLQPITDIHLNKNLPAGIEPISDPAYSYILSVIALLVLCIACINFMTLSISRSTSRAKEVGLRKTIGAQRGQLMVQFWSEAFFLTALSVILGVGLTLLLLPTFNSLVNQQLTFPTDGLTVFFILGVFVIVGLFAGSYPAVVLSDFKPIEVLKGKLRLTSDRSVIQRSLIVAQFALSIFLIAGTLLVSQQLHFLQFTHLGYGKDQVVMIYTTGKFSEGRAAANLLRNELSKEPAVTGITASMHAFGEDGWMKMGYKSDKGVQESFYINSVDFDYLKAMQIRLVAGRDFDRNRTTDSTQALIVNQAFVKHYGWKDPVGKKLPGKFPDHQIVGVVEDFHFESLHTTVKPLALVIRPDSLLKAANDVTLGNSSARISIRIQPGQIPATLATIKQKWASVAPTQGFDYTFLDERVNAQYRQEERLGKIVSAGSLLSILIACMGLFGLVSLTIIRRTKEIGIRKVLGASAGHIVLLISRDFALLVGIAFLLASPIAWWAVSQWLTNFAYRIPINGWVFVGAGMLALGIALLTVSFHAVKAALVNPVDSLRSE